MWQFPTAREVWLVLHDGAILGYVESLQWPVVIMGHNSLVGAGLTRWVQHAHFSQPLYFFLYLSLTSGGPAWKFPFHSCVSHCARVLKNHPNCTSTLSPDSFHTLFSPAPHKCYEPDKFLRGQVYPRSNTYPQTLLSDMYQWVCVISLF